MYLDIFFTIFHNGRKYIFLCVHAMDPPKRLLRQVPGSWDMRPVACTRDKIHFSRHSRTLVLSSTRISTNLQRHILHFLKQTISSVYILSIASPISIDFLIYVTMWLQLRKLVFLEMGLGRTVRHVIGWWRQMPVPLKWSDLLYVRQTETCSSADRSSFNLHRRDFNPKVIIYISYLAGVANTCRVLRSFHSTEMKRSTAEGMQEEE